MRRRGRGQVVRGQEDNILHGQFEEGPVGNPGSIDRPILNPEDMRHIQRPAVVPHQRPNQNEGDWIDLMKSGRFREGWKEIMAEYIRRRGNGQQACFREHCTVAVCAIFFLSIGQLFSIMLDAFTDKGIFREVAAFPGFIKNSIVLLTHLLMLIARFIFR